MSLNGVILSDGRSVAVTDTVLCQAETEFDKYVVRCSVCAAFHYSGVNIFVMINTLYPVQRNRCK